MEKILDRQEQINLKRNKTWLIIILTNTILISGMFWVFESAQDVGKLFVGGLGVISILSINPIVAMILLFFTDSKDWKKWCFTACIVSLVISVLYFSILF
ncbi:hypothetical protein WAF17_04670 [Bernardetia sp. ABR2-2B]|uniref:hypothetical protein n=1 Tax=Bernardetia sp. ABR2-2B TaxID=3127472 RepID=UPI0030D1B60A